MPPISEESPADDRHVLLVGDCLWATVVRRA
jgi:hypothetical protein